MPQMRPLLWLYIYFYSLMNCYFLFNINYFNKKYFFNKKTNIFFFNNFLNLLW